MSYNLPAIQLLSYGGDRHVLPYEWKRQERGKDGIPIDPCYSSSLIPDHRISQIRRAQSKVDNVTKKVDAKDRGMVY